MIQLQLHQHQVQQEIHIILVADHHNLVADHQSSYDEYLYVIETQYVVSDSPYNSLLEVSLTVGDDFNETSTNVVVLLADNDEFTGVYLTGDTVEFTGEPDSDSLLYFSGEDWQDPDNLTWYSSSSYFESDELSFLGGDNNDTTYVHVNGTFECQWNEVYSTSGNLTVYIGLAGKIQII